MTYTDVIALAAWPGVEQGISYGTPALRVRGKLLVRLREDGETLVVLGVGPDERDMLVAAAPDIFFFTAHYRNSAAVLVRLATITPERLAALLRRRWQQLAPKRLQVSVP